MAPLALWLSLASTLIVEGETSCPSPAEVADELRPLLPEEFSEPERRLRLSADNGQTVLLLSSAGGDVLARRALPEKGSCVTQAKRAAVVAAAWQAELSDEPIPPPPRVEEETALRATAPPAPAVPQARYTFRADLGLRISTSTNGVPTPDLEFGAGRSWGRLGFLATVAFPFPILMLGPTYILSEGRPSIGLRAQGILSLGTGTDPAIFLSPGMQLAMRVSFAPEGPRAFVEAAYEHYFVTGTYPTPNQVVLAGGIAFGGP